MFSRLSRSSFALRTWLVVLCAGPGACGDQGAQGSDGADAGPALDLPWPRELLPEAQDPPDNPRSTAKRLLGRALFYDPITSSDRATACVSCHSEIWGLGDQLPRSVGIEGRGAIGPGRVGPHMTRRNAQALWNVGLKEGLFWDGREPSLEAQALRPLENPDELNRDPDEVVREIAGIPAYVKLFEEAFPGEDISTRRP